jgi:hypothetical protein
MEYPRSCLNEIDALLSEHNAQSDISWRMLFDNPDVYVLTARNKDTKHVEGYAVYQVTDRIAKCIDKFSVTDDTATAIRRAAHGLLRWKVRKLLDIT